MVAGSIQDVHLQMTCVRTKPPQMQEVSAGHYAACHHTELTTNLETAQEAFSSEEFLQSGVNVQ